MAESLVWAFVIERGLDTGAELRLFWSRTDAQAATSEHLADVWADDGSLPADVDEAIAQYNELLSGTEHTFVGQFPEEGERPRCDLCGEPISLADAADADSWVHSADANDAGDHTAEFSPNSSGPG